MDGNLSKINSNKHKTEKMELDRIYCTLRSIMIQVKGRHWTGILKEAQEGDGQEKQKRLLVEKLKKKGETWLQD